MSSFLRSLEALPFARIGRNPDLVLAVGVAAIIGMLILPLPAPVLDVLLALNLALSAIVLVAALLSDKPLAISTFPSLLLITTLFRLALNVSTTRGILTKGSAGEVVKAFGEFVLRGDVVVGLVIFLLITLVQFLVIAKGAERVAEVGARFTLDAMPGKQMSIDAAVRSGSWTEEEGQRRREELGREAQFYGAMDGAMKFIKGDAIAGLVICALNLIAGFAIGVLRNHMDLATAAQTYSVLTVGDGLVSQIPALLITLASGVLATRVASAQTKHGLGGALQAELFQNPRVLAVGGFLSLALGLIPGLPIIPFALIAAALVGAAVHRSRHDQRTEHESKSKAETFQKTLDDKVRQAKAQRAQLDVMAPTVAPVGLDLGPGLAELLGFVPGVRDEDTDLLSTVLPDVRDLLYLETGVRVPGIRVRARVSGLKAGMAVLRINDVPVVSVELPLGEAMVFQPPESLRRLGVDAKPSRHPITGAPASLVPISKSAALADAGLTVWKTESLIALLLCRTLRERAKSLFGLEETAELLERLQKVCPSLVKEVVPKIVGIAQLADILKRLVDEGVSIRDMKSILEALAVHGPFETNAVTLTEHVRASLSAQIAHTFAGSGGPLRVVVLDGLVEDTVRGAICQAPGGSYLGLDPEIRIALLAAIRKTIGPVMQAGVRPVILTSADVRRYMRKLVEEDMPEIAVLSFQEMPSQLTIQPLGRVVLQDVRVAA